MSGRTTSVRRTSAAWPGRTPWSGLSTHDAQQIDEALAGEATYIAVGPIFGTSTKETGYSARGLELIARASGRGKPIVAIGGITLDRVPELVGAGATGIAVISDLLTGNDPVTPHPRIHRAAI